jgi:hypothetical protein
MRGWRWARISMLVFSALVAAFGVLKRKLYESTEQRAHAFEAGYCSGQVDPFSKSCGIPWGDWRNVTTPLSSQSASAGIFSLAFRNGQIGVAVGGDYKQPNESTRTAAYSTDGGAHWLLAESSPTAIAPPWHSMRL